MGEEPGGGAEQSRAKRSVNTAPCVQNVLKSSCLQTLLPWNTLWGGNVSELSACWSAVEKNLSVFSYYTVCCVSNVKNVCWWCIYFTVEETWWRPHGFQVSREWSFSLQLWVLHHCVKHQHADRVMSSSCCKLSVRVERCCFTGKVLADDGLLCQRQAAPPPWRGSLPDGVCEWQIKPVYRGVVYPSERNKLCVIQWCCDTWSVTGICIVLCEQGNLQVFYRDLPLSIQDGYEKFLSSSTVSLQQYQVRVDTQTRWRTARLNWSNDSFSSQRCLGIWRGLAMWCTDSIPGNRILMYRSDGIINMSHR